MPDRLSLIADGLRIGVANHSPFELVAESGGTHAEVTYDLEGHARLQPTSRHSIEVVDALGNLHSCMVTASGGPSGVHERSALVHDGRIIVAVGPRMCALRLPRLELDWNTQVDAATCFGVYYSEKHDCYVSHGELEVARVTLEGTVVWSSGGKDVFSEGFAMHDDYVEVIDFNRERCRITLSTGASSIVK